MKKISFLILLLHMTVFLSGQQKDLTVSGNFAGTPFIDFVNKLESSYSIKFFFDPEQVEGIIINASGKEMKLSEILRTSLAPFNLLFYLDAYNNVVIFGGTREITDILPVFGQEKVQSDHISPGENKPETVTKYFGSMTNEEPEIFTIGNREKTIPGKACIIRGRIILKDTGEPLVGAVLLVQETKIAVVTDQDGYFRISLQPGEYVAKASSISSKEKIFRIRLFSEGFLSLEVEKTMINIDEVTVSAKRNDNVQGIQMGVERITSKSIREIPVAMGERDLLKVAQLLPGVQTAGEGASGLIVRGGNTDQNLFYLNKIPVYNTSHLFGFFSAFSPDVVSDFTLYKSSVPARYGGRISSVFDITTKTGNKKKFFGQGGISPVTGHFAFEGPVVREKSSFVVSARSTYSDWILSRMNNADLRNSNAGFYDLSAGFNSSLNNENLVKAFGYVSSDRFTLSSTDDYTYSNEGGSFAWKRLFSASLTGDFSVVHSRYWFNHVNKQNVSEAYTHKYILNHEEARADFNLITPKNHKIQFGIIAILYHLDRGNILPYGDGSKRNPMILGKEKGVEGAIYLCDEFSVTPKLSLMGGMRYSFYGQLGPLEVLQYDAGKPKSRENVTGSQNFGKNSLVRYYSGPELRLAANYLTGSNNSLKISYNRIRQYIFMLSNTMAVSPDDQWKLADSYLVPPVSDQVSAGYYQDFPEKGVSISLEVYRKWIHNLVEYRDGASFISGEKAEMVLLQGKQDAQGIELMVKKNIGKTSGWLSYTYAQSTVLVKGEIPENSINNGLRYPSNYDRPHNLNLISTTRLGRRISSSFNIVYSTGRPITYPLAIYRYENQFLLTYSGRNQYRLPDYFRADLSLNLEGNLLAKKAIHSSWMLNVFNLLGRKNAYSVFFESNGERIRGYKLSIFAQPVITLSWNFKFGNYANE